MSMMSTLMTVMRKELRDLSRDRRTLLLTLLFGPLLYPVLLLGMGGSSLAPEVFSKMFGSRESYPSLSVLDSTDPEAVRAMQAAHRPAETLYIVSTKSGGTVETLSFLKTFYRQAMHEFVKIRRFFDAP